MVVEKSEGKANEECPTGLLQSKPKEHHLVINLEIKGKIHQWSFCREMSQNHLGDANDSSACVPITLSLCKMFCSSDALQILPSVDIWQSAVCNSIVDGRHMYDKISVTPGEYVSFIELCHKGHSANKHGSKMVVAVVVLGAAWFHYTGNATTTTQKQSDYKVGLSSFTLITSF